MKDKKDAKTKEGSNTEMKKERKKGKSGKAYFHVRNNDGDTIRTFSRKLKDGLNHITWSLNEDGVRFPSRSRPKPDSDKRGGYSVLPGEYQIMIKDGEHTGSTPGRFIKRGR